MDVLELFLMELNAKDMILCVDLLIALEADQESQGKTFTFF